MLSPRPARPSGSVTVVENVPIARDTYRLRLDDPAMARAIRPGQFLMIRPAARRPTRCWAGRSPSTTSSATRRARRSAVDVVYLVIGRGTAALAARRPGDACRSGGRWATASARPRTGPVVFVAGGIGQTPFLALGRWWLGRAAYGEPATGSPDAVRHLGHLALRRPDRRRSPPGSTTSRRPGSRSSWRPTTARPGITGSSPTSWRAGWSAANGRRRSSAAGPPPMLAALVAAGRAVRGPLRPLAREPHGLRLRRLLQLRRPDPPARRLGRPPPRLRRGADLPGERRRLVGRRALSRPIGPLTAQRRVRARIWSRSRAARS